MTEKEIADFVIQVVVAIGTLGVVVVAIWGDWFRDRFAAPRLTVELAAPIGSFVPINPLPGIAVAQSRIAFYVHARVVNKRRWVTAKNCRVLLREIRERSADGQFRSIPLSVPLRYVWSPSEATGPVVDIPVDHYFDFGHIVHPPLPGPEHLFTPVLYSYSNNFRGFVSRGQCLRFVLRVQADNYTRDDPVVIEVEWNGIWSDDLDTMRQNLRVTMIVEAPLDEPERPII
jgi:hypothetical protein